MRCVATSKEVLSTQITSQREGKCSVGCPYYDCDANGAQFYEKAAMMRHKEVCHASFPDTEMDLMTVR